MLKQYYEEKIAELIAEKERINNQIIPYRQFTWLDRIFRRKEIREYNDKVANSTPNSTLEGEIAKVEEEINRLEQEKKVGEPTAKTIKDLVSRSSKGKMEFTLEAGDEAIGKYMRDNCIDTSGCFGDKAKLKRLQTFKGLDDFMLVHKTEYYPVNDTIRTPKTTNAKRETTFNFRGEEYTVSSTVGNNSTHFALNGPVSNHFFGAEKWDTAKYAVVANFADVDRDNLLAINLEDTYFEGDVHFNKPYFIFKPKAEVEQAKQMNLDKNTNPNAIVIPYEGISLDEAIRSFIACIGKKPTVISNNDWAENEDFIESANNALAPFKTGKIYEGESHTNSKNMRKSFFEERANIMVTIYETLQSKGLDPSFDELKEIAKNLEHRSSWFKDETEMINKYYMGALEAKGYRIPENAIQDSRLSVPKWARPGNNPDDNYKYESDLDILDEYFIKGLLGGKIERTAPAKEAITPEEKREDLE